MRGPKVTWDNLGGSSRSLSGEGTVFEKTTQKGLGTLEGLDFLGEGKKDWEKRNTSKKQKD